MALTTMAIGTVVGGAMSYKQQSDAAKNQAAYQKQKNAAMTEAAIENYQELDKREQDVAYNTGQDGLDNQISALEAASSQEASASATGLRGGTSNMLLGDLARRKAQGNTDIRMSKDQQLGNINAQARSIANQTEASYDNTPIKRPSPWKAITDGVQTGQAFSGMAGQVQGAYRSYKQAAPAK